MNTIGKHMNIAMGVALSFCLSLVGVLTSGHFTAGAFITSFLLSTAVSLIIGFCVPLRKITESACKHMQPGTLKRRCAESLISDLAYTPVMTLLMILLAWFGAARHALRSGAGQGRDHQPHRGLCTDIHFPAALSPSDLEGERHRCAPAGTAAGAAGKQGGLTWKHAIRKPRA